MSSDVVEGAVPKVWPCVVVADRYGGTYSGAAWLAFNAYEVPAGPLADDVTCADFWDDVDNRMPVGRGNTPDEAVKVLAEKMAAWEQLTAPGRASDLDVLHRR